MKTWATVLFLAFACVLPCSAEGEQAKDKPAYTDVPEDHWAGDSLNLLSDMGILKGYPDGEFKGDRPVTRYELAVVLARVTELLAPIAQPKGETKKPVETANAVSGAPKWASDALAALKTGKYLGGDSPIITDGSKAATAEDVAAALASISARIIEMKVPADTPSEE